jgi:hypothetical protein
MIAFYRYLLVVQMLKEIFLLALKEEAKTAKGSLSRMV